MDPDDPRELKQILSMQCTLMGRHDSTLHQVSGTLLWFPANISQLSTRMDELAMQLTHLSTSATLPAPPALPPLASPAAPPLISSHLPREPYIPTPNRYSSDLGTCAQLLHPSNFFFSKQTIKFFL